MSFAGQPSRLRGTSELTGTQNYASLDDYEAALLRLREESKHMLPELQAKLGTSQQEPRSVSSASKPSMAGLPSPSIQAVQEQRPTTPKAELDSIRSAEALLAVENARLRQQVQHWRGAAATVAEREAHEVELLKGAKTSAESEVGPKDSLSLLTETVQTYVFNSGKAPLDNTANGLRMFSIFLCMNGVLFLAWRLCESSLLPFDAKGTKGPGTPLLSRKGDALRYLDPMLRFAGFGSYDIEASELQVGNLPPGGDVFVSVRTSGSREARTRAAERPSLGLLRFQEPLRILVTGGGSESETCTFRVVNADLPSEETVAVLEITTKELMRRVRSKHRQQYFNFHMVAQESGHQGPRPQLAMRLRDVTSSRQARA